MTVPHPASATATSIAATILVISDVMMDLLSGLSDIEIDFASPLSSYSLKVTLSQP